MTTPDSSRESAAASESGSSSTLVEDLVSSAILHSKVALDPNTLNDQLKRHKVKRTFQQISQLAIFLAIGVVLYYDLLMIWPHLGAMFWAVAVSVVLARPQRALLRLRERFDRRMAASKPWLMAGAVGAYVGVVLAAAGSPLAILCWSAAFGAVVFVLTGAPRLVVAACLVGAIVAALALPVAVVLKISSDEVNDMVVQIHDFVTNSAELHRMVDDLGSSRLLQYAGVRLPHWDADAVKAQAMSMASYATSHLSSMLNVSIVLVNRTSSAFVSLITFLTFLFYLLTDDPLRFYDGLSPFSESDTRHILDSVRKSLMRTLVCSATQGAIHALLTYLTFMICDLPFRLIVSTLSGLLSIMPFVGTWVIWVPVAVVFAVQGRYVQAAVVTLLQLFGDLYVDGVVRSYIPGNSYFVGLSVAMGGYVFGPEGVLAGPLLAGISMTLLDIFKDYTAEPSLDTAAVISEASVAEPVVLLPKSAMQADHRKLA